MGDDKAFVVGVTRDLLLPGTERPMAEVGLRALETVPGVRWEFLPSHPGYDDEMRPELIAGYEPWLQRVQVPGSVGNLLEYRLGQQQRDAVGYVAHVPHYVAQAEYPAAAAKLVECLTKATGLRISTEDLYTAAEAVRTEIDVQIAQSDEAASLVRALEEQYDAFTRGRESENLLAEPSGPLPTAEEIGAELERFLAEHTRNGDDQ